MPINLTELPLESAVEVKVTEYAKEVGCLHIKLNVQGSRGWPDHLYLYRGKVLFVEFKRWEEKPRKLQEYRIGKLRSEGFAAIVVDNYRSGRDCIDALTLSGKEL